MAVGRSRQGTNQAGALAPLRSVWGQQMFAGTSQLIDQPAPIGWRPNNFGGTVGGMITVAASMTPRSAERGYFGDLPQSEQANVEAPDPWDRV